MKKAGAALLLVLALCIVVCTALADNAQISYVPESIVIDGEIDEAWAQAGSISLDNAYYQTDLPVVSIPGGHGIPYVCHLDGNRLTLESRDIIAPGREHPLYVYERIE